MADAAYWWKVRTYYPSGNYAICQIRTRRDTAEIDLIQDFYEELTGCKLLLEGMADRPFEETSPIGECFRRYYHLRGDREC